MNIFYSIILLFGVLLSIYTLVNLISTKKKINPHDASLNRTQEFIKAVKSKILLWRYYFIAGEESNLLRNILISIVALMFCFYLNKSYIQMNQYVFLALFLFAFIFIVWKLGQRRNRKIFEDSFPEVIQVLNSSTSSGAGLLQALERCGKDIVGQLGDEFKNIHKRLAIGEDPTTIFEDSYTRYPYKEFYYFITIIRINLNKGGQMREVISRLGRVIADSRKMDQKKRAMTSEARISALIVGCFPIAFSIFMKIMMPENFDFVMNDPNGRLILYYVVGSEVLGMSIIWWLMRKTA